MTGQQRTPHQTLRTRNGKIARLPHDVREELNLRLERSERSPQLLAWLNALPAVREFVRGEFNGEPVSKHNLSQWRRGGFQDWLIRRDFFAEARRADAFVAERQQAGEKALADQAATVLAAQYAGLLGRWDGKCTTEFEARARVLNGLCRGVTKLQREAHKANWDNLAMKNQASSQSVAVSSSDKIIELVRPPADLERDP
jgi:hypothetical protein